MMPIHSDLLDYWKENKETDPIKKALSFLLSSNMTWLGIGDKIHTALKNHKKPFEENIDKTNEMLKDVIFNNLDVVDFLKPVYLLGE